MGCSTPFPCLFKKTGLFYTEYMIGRDEIALRILCHHNSVYIIYLSYPPPFLTAVLFYPFPEPYFGRIRRRTRGY